MIRKCTYKLNIQEGSTNLLQSENKHFYINKGMGEGVSCYNFDILYIWFSQQQVWID